MIVVCYLIPLVACLLLYFGYGYALEDWFVYALVAIPAWIVTGFAHWRMYRYRTTSEEFLGGYMAIVQYEAAWTEIEHYTETETDSKGNTRTVEKTRHVHHPPLYYAIPTVGKQINLDSSTFWAIASRWGATQQNDSWCDSDIVGGMRFGCHFCYNDVINDDAASGFLRMIPITATHTYTNRVKNSNSIFRFEHLEKADTIRLGLLKYPEFDGWNQHAIISGEFTVDHDVIRAYDRFNAMWAPDNEMRLFVLLFDADHSDITIADKQRAYWTGGNKNEFVVCLGLSNNTVVWARAWSWADEPTLEVKTEAWFREHKTLDMMAYLSWLKENYTLWKRKEFADFNYIRVNLTLTQQLVMLALAVATSAGMVYWGLSGLFLLR